jgi:predicted Zn-dependent protease
VSGSDGLAIEARHDPIMFVIMGDVDRDVSYSVLRSLRQFLRSCEQDLEYVPPVKVIRRPGPRIDNELDSEDILMRDIKSVPGKIVLGLTEAGLYDRGMARYIFGNGSGSTAVMSTRRFRMVPGGKERMKERLGKEIIKVLSLALYTGSCARQDCILVYHRHVEDLDVNVDVCPDCRLSLVRGIRSCMEPEQGDELP